MKVEAARRYHFQAVHSLPDFPEPWNRTHGHRYTVELVGEFNHEVADDYWGVMRDRYELVDLNNVVKSTTVEALAAHFFAGFELIPGIREVTVWEDDDRWGRATR